MTVTTPEKMTRPAGDDWPRIRVDEYLQMAASGYLAEGAPIELLDGMLVWKDRRDHEGSITVVGIRHIAALENLDLLLQRDTDGHGCFVRSQQPIQLSDVNMPEPDVMVIRGARAEFRHRYPVGEDALLVVEVADSSLKHDRSDKLSKYAAAGIQEYWIVDLLDNVIEVYQQPDAEDAGYRLHVRRGMKDEVLFTCPDGTLINIRVADVVS